MASEELQNIIDRAREAFAAVDDLTDRHDAQEVVTDRANRAFVDGTGDGQNVSDEKAKLAVLKNALDGKQAEAWVLLKEYELQLRREMVRGTMEHLQAASSEAGTLFDEYLAFRKEFQIFGRSRAELAKEILGDLKLTHSSVHLIAGFRTALGITPGDLGVNFSRAKSGAFD